MSAIKKTSNHHVSLIYIHRTFTVQKYICFRTHGAIKSDSQVSLTCYKEKFSLEIFKPKKNIESSRDN